MTGRLNEEIIIDFVKMGPWGGEKALTETGTVASVAWLRRFLPLAFIEPQCAQQRSAKQMGKTTCLLPVRALLGKLSLYQNN